MGVPVDQSHNHFIGNIIQPPNDRLSLSGIQQVTLLGPFRVEWNTEGINDAPGYPVADIEAGQTVISAWAELLSWWNGSDVNNATDIEILVGGADWETANTWPVVLVNVHENGPSGIADANIAPSASPTTFPNGGIKPQRAKTAGKLLVKISLPGNTTAGEADIYALIVTPV